MVSFVNDPMYPMKTLCREKMYVLSNASSNIFVSASSMLFWFSCMIWASALPYCSYERTDVVACAGTLGVPPGSTIVL